MTLIVLYEELAAYFVKCISTFALQHNAEVHVIRKEVNKEAPFKFDVSSVKIYDRSEYSEQELLDLVKKIDPDALFCGGWSTKVYLKIASVYHGKIPTVIGFDNNWTGSLKQHLAGLAAPFFLTNKFDRCFVPGPGQEKFALKMGFKKAQIVLGAYCCDFNLFNDQYLKNKEKKRSHFPKRFIYVGRYVEHKGVKDLWQAFSELQDENPNDWELWCLGTGDVEPCRNDKIKHFGFVQPDGLPGYIQETGVFVLPSHFEPWGVVVHEFASAGFPIICTEEVGARTAFVENNFNGYIYTSGNIRQLKEILKKIMQLNDIELSQMGDRSVEKAKLITPEIWSRQLEKLLQ